MQVYDAIINARKHSEFTGAEATCDPVVGGKFTAWDKYISGTNVELVRGRRIVQHWQTTEWPVGYPPSQMVWTFGSKNDGTESRWCTRRCRNHRRPHAGRAGWIIIGRR